MTTPIEFANIVLTRVRHCQVIGLRETIERAREQRQPRTLIDAIPYARLIGVECEPQGDALIFRLPRNDDNLGNPTLPALHGGVIGGFMEVSALLHILLAADNGGHTPKVIDFSVDYLRPGRHRDTYAQCEILRKGRNIVNVAVRAWQTRHTEPIATARAHFLLAPPKT